MRGWLGGCALAILSAASPAAAAEHGPAPAVMTAMLQLYGRYDPARHCWLATARDGDARVTACIAIAQADDGDAPEGKRTYMLLAGRSEQGALVAAFVEFGGTHGLRVVAHSPALLLDTLPEQPRIVLQRLGAAQWGWISDVKANRDSDRNSDYEVWLPRAGDIEPIARFPHVREDVTMSYRIDALDAQADYYPILLQAHGTKNRLASGQAVARFDLAHYRYDVTPGLP